MAKYEVITINKYTAEYRAKEVEANSEQEATDMVAVGSDAYWCCTNLIYGDEEGESFDDFVAASVSEEDRAALKALWADHSAHVFEWELMHCYIPF